MNKLLESLDYFDPLLLMKDIFSDKSKLAWFCPIHIYFQSWVCSASFKKNWYASSFSLIMSRNDKKYKIYKNCSYSSIILTHLKFSFVDDINFYFGEKKALTCFTICSYKCTNVCT